MAQISQAQQTLISSLVATGWVKQVKYTTTNVVLTAWRGRIKNANNVVANLPLTSKGNPSMYAYTYLTINFGTSNTYSVVYTYTVQSAQNLPANVAALLKGYTKVNPVPKAATTATTIAAQKGTISTQAAQIAALQAQIAQLTKGSK